MTQPGEVERPPGGDPASPDPAAPPQGVSVAWLSPAARPAAGKLADDGAAAALAAKDATGSIR
jgi:hypothetical protein